MKARSHSWTSSSAAGRHHHHSGKESPNDSAATVPLARSPGRDLLAGVTVVEMEIRYAQGWAMHDCPLTMDPDAWYAMINAERAALARAFRLRPACA